jgi:hypothetical protein
VPVFRQPGAADRRDRIGQAVDHGAGRVALVDSRGEEQRLERRARLPPRLRRAIEAALVEIAPAHQREHVAGHRVERDQAGFERLVVPAALIGLVALQRAQASRHGLLGRALQLRREGRVDTKPILIQLIGSEAFHDEAPDFFLEIQPTIAGIV